MRSTVAEPFSGPRTCDKAGNIDDLDAGPNDLLAVMLGGEGRESPEKQARKQTRASVRLHGAGDPDQMSPSIPGVGH